jgi:hypothetical protein
MYASINNNGYFQGIYASHSQILHLFQFAGEMSNSHMYKFPQITYIPIIWLLTVRERFIFQKTEKKNTVQRLVYQGVN